MAPDRPGRGAASRDVLGAAQPPRRYPASLRGGAAPWRRAGVAAAAGARHRRGRARIGGALEAADRASVVTFGTHVTEVAPLGPSPVVFDLRSAGGITSGFDAVLLSLVTAPSPGRRQLTVVMTGAADTASEFDSPIVRRTAGHASGQMAFVITRPTSAFGFGRRWGEVMSTLRAVAETTGGQLVELHRDEELSDAFLAALDDFRTSYVLRYRPAGVKLAGWHEVTVAVKGWGYSVRARRGYWGFQ